MSTTRRAFLKKSLSATGAALFPLIVPAHVLGRGGGVTGLPGRNAAREIIRDFKSGRMKEKRA